MEGTLHTRSRHGVNLACGGFTARLQDNFCKLCCLSVCLSKDCTPVPDPVFMHLMCQQLFLIASTWKQTASASVEVQRGFVSVRDGESLGK